MIHFVTFACLSIASIRHLLRHTPHPSLLELVEGIGAAYGKIVGAYRVIQGSWNNSPPWYLTTR